MDSTKDLFGDTANVHYPNRPGHVRHNDTSHAAARSMDNTAGSIRDRVYAAIKANGQIGVTSDYLEETMGRHQTISARVRELVLLGKIRDSGQRRKTRSGRSARVYVAIIT